MAIKFPIEYEITPKSVDPGTRWLTLTIKNIGTTNLTALDVRLNSLDAYSLWVYGTGSYVPELAPNEERVVPFQVSANATGSLYISFDGWRETEPYHWESPAIQIKVGQEVAELASLFALTKPYAPLGENLKCEALLRGLADSEGLRLEFWAEDPGGEFKDLATIDTKQLDFGEEVRYATEFTPEQEGLYTVYAYLFDNGRRIGRKVEYVYVR